MRAALRVSIRLRLKLLVLSLEKAKLERKRIRKQVYSLFSPWKRSTNVPLCVVTAYLPQKPDCQSQQQQSSDDAACYHSHRNVAFHSGFTDGHYHLDSKRTGDTACVTSDLTPDHTLLFLPPVRAKRRSLTGSRLRPMTSRSGFEVSTSTSEVSSMVW